MQLSEDQFNYLYFSPTNLLISQHQFQNSLQIFVVSFMNTVMGSNLVHVSFSLTLRLVLLCHKCPTRPQILWTGTVWTSWTLIGQSGHVCRHYNTHIYFGGQRGAFTPLGACKHCMKYGNKTSDAPPNFSSVNFCPS